MFESQDRLHSSLSVVSRSLLGGLLLLCAGVGSGCGREAAALPPSAEPLAQFESALSQVIPALPYTGTASANLALQSSIATAGPLDGRPYKFKVPSGYDSSKPTPLLLMLHGFGASADLENLYIGLAPLADARTFLYAYPDGTQNPLGMRFWNATDFCCNFFGSTVDDVAYLTAIIDDMEARFNVDKKRIFVVGHSNGGFMAHRMACDRSSRIAGFVSLAGQQWNDATKCKPTEAVAALQVHGTADAIVGYDGSLLYPSARTTQTIWGNRNRCTGVLTYEGRALDLELLLPGSETKIETTPGCPSHAPVELWTIQGGSHLPLFTSYWPGAIYDFLYNHPKP